MTDTPSPGEAETIVVEWPEEPRKIAEAMIDKYGEPDEASRNLLVWHGNGPWKRTEVSRQGTPHRFPKPHEDHLEQVVDYHVPIERADQVTAFDGSLTIDRTRGELASRCDREPMNILAVNLAHEVASGELTVDEARHELTTTGMKEEIGTSPEWTRELQFDTTGHRGDPDVEILDEGTGTANPGRDRERGDPP